MSAVDQQVGLPIPDASALDKAKAAVAAARGLTNGGDITDLSITDQARYADLLAIASIHANIARAEAAEREAAAMEQLAGLLVGRFG
jgi:hypothetical protein